MVERPVDLISMADIARLAGQSRATVGNWKARNPEDFPPERGRGSRGPLYDRAEVTTWLEATSRLDKRSAETTAVWRLVDDLRAGVRVEDAMPLLLLLLATMSKASPSAWTRLTGAQAGDLERTLRSSAEALFPFADEVLPAGELPAQPVARAIATLSGLDKPRLGVMADALLEQAAKSLGHRGGDFLTPTPVRRLVVAIAEPKGTVYNPATGVGQLMIAAAESPTSRAVRCVGQEINRQIWAMAQLNCAIHDVAADVALGDVFSDDHFPQLRADRVISVPPWGQKLPYAEALSDDPRWVWGEPGPNDGNYAWVQHCLSRLADDGRAVIVLPNGALYEGGRAGRIRQRIVKAGLLDAVFALPPGLFEWTGLPCAVVVFTKGRTDVDGKPASTLMVDLSESTSEDGGRSGALDDNLVDEVASVYRRWTKGQQPSAEYAAVATFDDLAANDFVIDPGRYLSLAPAPADLGRAAETRSELTERLQVLTRASRDADDALQAILGTRR